MEKASSHFEAGREGGLIVRKYEKCRHGEKHTQKQFSHVSLRRPMDRQACPPPVLNA
jgi:hypothetical protein